MKPTLEEIEFATATMNKLFSHYNFTEAITLYHNGYGYVAGLYKWRKNFGQALLNEGFSFHAGETKVCIIVPSFNWVIKVGIKPCHFDYCAKEAKNFQNAKEWGLSDFFAATYNIGEVRGWSIYLQEYAAPDEDAVTSALRTWTGDTHLMSDDGFDDEDRVRAVFGADYGSDIIDFICENRINDLHSGNFGVTRDGRIVIFDFSGYRGSESGSESDT